MVFNTWTFLVFILIVMPLYYALPHRRQNWMLLAASYVFYGWWDWRFLALLFASTLVDYKLALWIDASQDQRRRFRMIVLSCVVNLTILGFFKYFNFFIDSLNTMLAPFDVTAESLRLHVILPVGVSFYTFQSMSYTIDVYRRDLKAERNFWDFALYIAYFPQLVAGPIERATHLLPQMTQPRTVTRDGIICGCWLILAGLFKKVVVADNLALVVDRAFGADPAPSGFICLLATWGFVYQVYCDFAGYSDIARGIGKWMGVDIMVNFDRPYLSANPSEFWRRWHISLSTWLRDYVYIPLGGSRSGGVYRNLFLTMTLGGFWHGASAVNVVWGMFCGACLCLHRWAAVDKKWFRFTGLSAKAWHVLSIIIFFNVHSFGLLLFRAGTFDKFWTMLWQICFDFAVGPEAAEAVVLLLFTTAVLWFLEIYAGPADDPRRLPLWNRGLGPIIATLMFLGIVFLTPQHFQPFIYFQF